MAALRGRRMTIGPLLCDKASGIAGPSRPTDILGRMTDSPNDKRSMISRNGLRATVEAVHTSIRSVYSQYPQPLVIGYSGGKDSTAVLQLVWNALSELPTASLEKPVYVIASDTGVETPLISALLARNLARLQAAAHEVGLPFRSSLVRPALADSFWVNLIGRGYPAPTAKFRWCTDRLKIRPANTFVQRRVAEFGEVIMVLGVRSGESSTRSQLMNSYRVSGHQLRRHSTLPGAYVFAPIEDFTADDVWTYLLQVPSPWGGDNAQLAALYRDASSGECPLVIDTTTPSCGNTRFGCWVCTVAVRDSSMEALVDSGEDWLAPMLELRDLLARTTNPELKTLYRDTRALNGRVYHKKDGSLIPRAYKFEFSVQLLQSLLEIEGDLYTQGKGSEHCLISIEELCEIRRIWRLERQDWADTVPVIYRRVRGQDLEWTHDDTMGLGAASKGLLEEACLRNGVPTDLVLRLVDAERRYANMSRRRGLFQDLSSLLKQDWSVPADVVDAGPPEHLTIDPCE
jgi:DNA sulfur modification protein DndC